MGGYLPAWPPKDLHTAVWEFFMTKTGQEWPFQYGDHHIRKGGIMDDFIPERKDHRGEARGTGRKTESKAEEPGNQEAAHRCGTKEG